jgi:uracil-DNA glycosylase
MMNYTKNIDLKELFPQKWREHIDLSILNDVTKYLNIEKDKNNDSEFYPFNQNDIFKIFHLCNLEDIKVVILGQDPYHSSKCQANGIAFSVNQNVKIPPSLRNIFKEANIKPSHGDLSDWVKQGVFLLNASLTVTQKTPNSHEYIWRKFITHIIDVINEKCNNIIFVSWGNFALNRYSNLNLSKHKLLCSSHPSPLSCYKTDNPFIGSNVFTEINKSKKAPIKWELI